MLDKGLVLLALSLVFNRGIIKIKIETTVEPSSPSYKISY